MAANMQQQQMGGAGQFMSQQQNRPGMGPGTGMGAQGYIINAIRNSTHPTGWQTQVAIAERVKNILQLYTNMVLLTGDPHAQQQKILDHVLGFEQDALRNAPEKAAYERRIQERMHELHSKRQVQAPMMQENLNLQSAQTQRQQMLINQQNQNAALMRAQMAGRGMSPGQQPFQHLQNPMQISQLQQQPPQMGFNMNNGMPPHMSHGPPGFPMSGGPQSSPHQMPLSEIDKQRVQQDAQAMFTAMPPETKKSVLDQAMSLMSPMQLSQAHNNTKNIIMTFCLNRAHTRFMNARQQQMQQQRQPGMSNNFQGVSMQSGQQRPMNTNMMHNLGPGSMPFGSMENILHEQKQALVAEQRGQVVVPAHSGPGPNGASQPAVGNLQHQNIYAQGPGQNRPQMSMDMQQQQQLQRQALMQQQQQMARQAAQAMNQGPPGGLNGPMSGSQAPAMNPINTSGPPQGAMSQIANGQAGPGNRFGPGLDPRFNQPGQSDPTATAELMMQQILNRVTPEQKDRIMKMTPHEKRQLLMKYRHPGHPDSVMKDNQIGMPNQQGNANQPPNLQSAMLQQQQQKMKHFAQLQNNPQAMQIMDTMDFPPGVRGAVTGIPDGVTKWGELKSWLAQNPNVPADLKNKLSGAQIQQFLNHRAVSARNAALNSQQQQQGAARPQPTPEELARISVSPQDMQMMRANHLQLRDAPEAQVRHYVQLMKWNTARQNSISGARPQPGPGFPQTTTMPTTQPDVPQVAPMGLSQGQSNPTIVSAPEPPANVRPATQLNKFNKPPQQAKPLPQNPSPAVAQAVAPKNLKRSNEGDLEGSSQPPASGPRPASQTGQQNIDPGSLSEAQLASMTPEQRQNFERRRQMAAMQKQRQEPILAQLRKLIAEETQKFDPSAYSESEMMQNVAKGQLMKIAHGFNKLQPVLATWYMMVRDDERTRLFIRLRLRVLSQFQDDKMSVLKDRLTVSQSDISHLSTFLSEVFYELKSKQIGQGGQPQLNQTVQKPIQAPQPQPIEATSIKQAQSGAQSHSKLPQRPNSRGIVPPAAPTSTQPPFQFGAASPDGKPVYAATPQLTQDNLQLPRKKIKTGMQTSSPAGGSQTASPQTKAMSPDLRKQQEAKAVPPKPTFPCTVNDCEMGAPIFSSDALRKKHINDFHMQPFQDPAQFLEQAIQDVFGHDQTKADATPLQGNVVGGLATQSRKPEDKTSATSTGQENMAAAVDAQQNAVVDDFTMVNGTIDPQSLFAPAYNYDPVAGGVISNTSLYRSATPNEDTPESSKDSGASEPNSDIPEAGSLDIELDLTPALYFHDSLSLNSPNDGYYQNDEDVYHSANLLEHIVASKSYEIPQNIDMSLYGMDC